MPRFLTFAVRTYFADYITNIGPGNDVVGMDMYTTGPSAILNQTGVAVNPVQVRRPIALARWSPYYLINSAGLGKSSSLDSDVLA